MSKLLAGRDELQASIWKTEFSADAPDAAQMTPTVQGGVDRVRGSRPAGQARYQGSAAWRLNEAMTERDDKRLKL